MPKPHTLPTLYDDVIKLNITDLRKWKYLEKGYYKKGSVEFSSNGNNRGNITIYVDTRAEKYTITLIYSYNGQGVKYSIDIVSLPSNLGKGKVFYFVCPVTQKRCRKLYCIGGEFLHREAFKGCMYESQTYSKTYRSLNKTIGAFFRSDRHYDTIYSKHFKKTYAGKPTKRYLKLMKEINKGESIPIEEVKRMMYKTS